MREEDPKKAEKMEHDLEKKIIFEKKTKEVEVMTEKFKEARRFVLSQRSSWRRRRGRT